MSEFPCDDGILERRFKNLRELGEAPEFWVCTPGRAAGLLESLSEWKRVEIGHSVAGRPICAYEFGEEEPLEGITSGSLQSSLAAEVVKERGADRIFPESFYGSKPRSKPVLVLQCGIHGGEYTGTVAALNFARIVETGADLRGREWPRLAELGRRMRLALVPWLNIDAAARWRAINTNKTPREVALANVQGLKPDGSNQEYRLQKNNFPLDPAQVGFLGCYFNCNGVNLQYDLFQSRPQPETAAWIDYYRSLRPDAVLNFHCDSGSCFLPPCYYLPPGFQHLQSWIGGHVHARLTRDGFPVRRQSWVHLPGMGKPFMDQNTAIYFASGALPLLCELPFGGLEYPHWTFDRMLDCGLVVIEEVLAAADSDGLRPYTTSAKGRVNVRVPMPVNP